MNNLVKTAITAAKKGAKLIRASYGKVITYKNKSPSDLADFVTEVDKKVERLIIKEINKNFPDHSILGEEYGKFDKSKEFTWIIDPIDGTKNFIRGFNQFATSIGIIKRNQPYAGIIYRPLENKSYCAVIQKGAFLERNRLKVSKTTKLGKAALAMNHGKTANIRKHAVAALNNIWDIIPIIKIQGSTAYSVTQLIQGKFDALIDNGDYWDFAAALVLVEEAGGEVTTWSGKKVNENSKFVLWSNGRLHKPLLSLLPKINQ